MPIFNVCLAQDISYYGSTSVEGETWEDAVRTLHYSDWWDACHKTNDEGWEQRIVYVETEDGDVLAEDINYQVYAVDRTYVAARLDAIIRECDLSDEAAAALVAFVDELRTMSRDPVFKEPVFKKEGV